MPPGAQAPRTAEIPSMTQHRPTTPVLSTGSVASEVSLLFRTKRVSEIRTYEKQIRHEADDKSDSLRDLLGTRYRDLLRAADEMSDIRDASVQKVRDALRDLANDAAALRDRFEKQASATPATAVEDLERRKGVHEIGRKLKDIVDSPEVLYACLESGEVYNAAKRFSLAARHYREVTETSGLEGVANKFAERRWKQVEVFKSQILSAAEKRLVTPGLESKTYAEVLASLIILTEGRDVVPLLNGMLAARTGWVDDEHRAATGVAERLCAIARVVRSTISCVTNMIWRDMLDRLLDGVDQEALALLKKARDDGSLRDAMVLWTRGLQAWLDEHGAGILAAASSSRALADTLRAIDDVFDVEGWEDDCRRALSQPPSFVFEIFKPFVSDRASVVASACIERAVGKVLSDIDEVWTDFEVAPPAGKVMWSVVSNETVGLRLSTEDENDGDANKEDVDVSRVLSSHGQVSSVLGTFELSLTEALDDATVLAQRISSVADSFDESVRSFLPQILSRLREKLDSIPQASEDKAPRIESCDLLMERALFVARAATTLENAKCVKSAYCFSSKDVQKCRENLALKEFRQTAAQLSASGYETWANRLCSWLRTQLLSSLTSERVLTVPMGWSTGQDLLDSGDATSNADSVLRYPTTASTALVNFALRACDAATRAGGFALPVEAIQYLREEMTSATVEVYKTGLQLYTGESNQEQPEGDTASKGRLVGADTAVMQMLFDVMVLKHLLGEPVSASQTSKKPLKSLESSIQSFVDPIDLAVCKSALQKSVLNYVSRTGTLLGMIGQNSSGKQNLNRPPTNLSAGANLVALSRSVPRFTYLPAPMPSTYSATSSGTAGLNAKAAIELLRTETAATSGARKRESDISVAGYASKVSESVGRFGRGFFESLTRNVG